MRILNIRESSWVNEAPPAVWRRILALEEWPEWHDDLESARWLGVPGWATGRRFRIVPAGPSRPLLRGGTVTAVEAGREVRWAGRWLALRVEFALAVSAEGVGTRVELRSTFRGFAVRIAGQDSVARALSEFQRRFLAELRESGECVGVREG